jgi:hypothetical protein
VVGRFQGAGSRSIVGAWRKYLDSCAIAGDHAISAFRVAGRGGEKATQEMVKSRAALPHPVEIEIAGAVVRVTADIAEE